MTEDLGGINPAHWIKYLENAASRAEHAVEDAANKAKSDALSAITDAEQAAVAAQHGIVTAIRAQADPAGSLTTAQINHIADALAAVDVASEVDDAVDKLLEGNND